MGRNARTRRHAATPVTRECSRHRQQQRLHAGELKSGQSRATNQELSARSQSAALAAQQSGLQAQLQQAQQTLSGLEGARAAAHLYAAQQAAAHQAPAQQIACQRPCGKRASPNLDLPALAAPRTAFARSK